MIQCRCLTGLLWERHRLFQRGKAYSPLDWKLRNIYGTIKLILIDGIVNNKAGFLWQTSLYFGQLQKGIYKAKYEPKRITTFINTRALFILIPNKHFYRQLHPMWALFDLIFTTFIAWKRRSASQWLSFPKETKTELFISVWLRHKGSRTKHRSNFNAHNQIPWVKRNTIRLWKCSMKIWFQTSWWRWNL